ncbi:MAG: UvrD-helicase domain-containing protein [Candidatus Pacebacteria bacterium]|jgi:DNA helicase-2/ATP-dependent DNA helicase PcrA|nr:UvrD-helicase domain-containing protein [Candidatus Paceibacterota bacterium]
MHYLESLNDKQKEAVLYTEGPLLIVAGAGAGKTKTVTHRIIHLINLGVSPESILAVTFTNKAAKEMRERVMSLLESSFHGVPSHEQGRQVPLVSTFHSLGVRIIKEHATKLGLTKHFTIADDHDTMVIIKDAMKKHDIDPKQHEPRKIRSIISKAKGDFITVDAYRAGVTSGLQSIVAVIWGEYERALKKEKALDFDDLLLETVLLLKKYPEIKNEYRTTWNYIHIDEYQDTNEVQYELVKLLVGPKENICVVGDTDQNIYSWRGANIKNMLHFEKDYPDAKIILLEQNYRSTKNIIEAANAVIEKNQYRVPKNLFTENTTGEHISIYEAYDEVHEAEFIATTIHELLKHTPAEEIAILYRANFQSRVLEESLLGQNIPYQVLGVKFFERKEIKDVLSYIRAAYNRESLSDIKRIINTPTRGIGKVTLLKLFTDQMSELPLAMQQKINMFYNTLEEIRVFGETHTPSELIKFVLEKSGLEKELAHGTTDEQERLENMRELVTLATKYDTLAPGEGLEKLLEDASLASDQDTLLHTKGTGVRLMTVHASKGLEFSHVFIAGLEQDLFPHANGKATKEGREEERRLFYVALTRARHKLYLSYAQLRTIYGMKQVTTPSEFIYDIPMHITYTEETLPRNGERIIYI